MHLSFFNYLYNTLSCLLFIIITFSYRLKQFINYFKLNIWIQYYTFIHVYLFYFWLTVFTFYLFLVVNYFFTQLFHPIVNYTKHTKLPLHLTYQTAFIIIFAFKLQSHINYC